MGWSIHSFDKARWDASLGAGAAGVEPRILDALLWEENGYFGDEGTEAGALRPQVLASETGKRALKLAKHVAKRGVSYQDLNVKEADLLDVLIANASAAEPVGDSVGFQTHSDGSVGMGLFNELMLRARKAAPSSSLLDRLLGRAQPAAEPVAVWLPLFTSGRRFETHQDTARHALHMVLEPAEVKALRAELAALAKLPPTPGFPFDANTHVREGLIWPLDEVIESGRWALLRYA